VCFWSNVCSKFDFSASSVYCLGNAIILLLFRSALLIGLFCIHKLPLILRKNTNKDLLYCELELHYLKYYVQKWFS